MASPSPKFDIPRHIKFWLRCASLLPDHYISTDASRISLGFFIVSALDLLGILESHISLAERQSWIDWIYSCQAPEGGFRGFPGTNLGAYRNLWNKGWDPPSLANTYLALLTLVILGDDLKKVRKQGCLEWVRKLQKANGSFGEFLGDDGNVVGKDDLRTCYCAVGTAYVLQTRDEEPSFGVTSLLRFISNCQDYDGGCGQSPLREAHSGVNFCAVAAIACLEKLTSKTTNSEDTPNDTGLNLLSAKGSFDVKANIDWIVCRQTTWVEESDDDDDDDDDKEEQNSAQNSNPNANTNLNPDALYPPPAGFNGRPSKMADTCYAFWNTGALAILCGQADAPSPSQRISQTLSQLNLKDDPNTHLKNNPKPLPTSTNLPLPRPSLNSLLNIPSLQSYLLLKTQNLIGGFSKDPGSPPDVMHSYLGLACLALVEEGLELYPDGVKLDEKSGGDGGRGDRGGAKVERDWGLKKVDAMLVVSQDVAERVERLREGL